MKFETLLKIANTRIDFPNENLPLNSYDIAIKQLNIVIKNSLQCKIDYRTSENPLSNNEAVYSLFKGEYTIYYDENNPYKNFFIAHEIAHHLLNHTNDGLDKHHDVNLLGAIIVAPPHLIKKYKITNSIMLSEQCKIPIEVADTYWKEYTYNYLNKETNNFLIYALFVVIIAVCGFTLGHITSYQNNLQSDVIPKSQNTSIINQTQPTELETVYITRYGKRYHRADCYHIRGSQTFEISIEEAESLEYSACKDCF